MNVSNWPISNPGEIIIIGPVGTGKTVLLRAVFDFISGKEGGHTDYEYDNDSAELKKQSERGLQNKFPVRTDAFDEEKLTYKFRGRKYTIRSLAGEPIFVDRDPDEIGKKYIDNPLVIVVNPFLCDSSLAVAGLLCLTEHIQQKEKNDLRDAVMLAAYMLFGIYWLENNSDAEGEGEDAGYSPPTSVSSRMNNTRGWKKVFGNGGDYVKLRLEQTSDDPLVGSAEKVLSAFTVIDTSQTGKRKARNQMQVLNLIKDIAEKSVEGEQRYFAKVKTFIKKYFRDDLAVCLSHMDLFQRMNNLSENTTEEVTAELFKGHDPAIKQLFSTRLVQTEVVSYDENDSLNGEERIRFMGHVAKSAARFTEAVTGIADKTKASPFKKYAKLLQLGNREIWIALGVTSAIVAVIVLIMLWNIQ